MGFSENLEEARNVMTTIKRRKDLHTHTYAYCEHVHCSHFKMRMYIGKSHLGQNKTLFIVAKILPPVIINYDRLYSTHIIMTICWRELAF